MPFLNQHKLFCAFALFMVNQIMMGMFKAYFPWQSEDNITVNYIILIKHCKGSPHPQVKRVKHLSRFKQGKLEKAVPGQHCIAE